MVVNDERIWYFIMGMTWKFRGIKLLHCAYGNKLYLMSWRAFEAISSLKYIRLWSTRTK